MPTPTPTPAPIATLFELPLLSDEEEVEIDGVEELVEALPLVDSVEEDVDRIVVVDEELEVVLIDDEDIVELGFG